MTKRTRPRRVKAAMVSDTSWGPNWPSIHRWELPRTAAAYDAMCEQVAWGLAAHAFRRFKDDKPWSDCLDSTRASYLTCARVALRAIGIIRPRK